MEDWYGKHYSYFQNRECEYFPCHAGANPENFSCLFCYCPLYGMNPCPGSPEFIESHGRLIKSCAGCTFPHRAENYEKIIACLSGR